MMKVIFKHEVEIGGITELELSEQVQFLDTQFQDTKLYIWSLQPTEETPKKKFQILTVLTGNKFEEQDFTFFKSAHTVQPYDYRPFVCHLFIR